MLVPLIRQRVCACCRPFLCSASEESASERYGNGYCGTCEGGTVAFETTELSTNDSALSEPYHVSGEDCFLCLVLAFCPRHIPKAQCIRLFLYKHEEKSYPKPCKFYQCKSYPSPPREAFLVPDGNSKSRLELGHNRNVNNWRKHTHL